MSEPKKGWSFLTNIIKNIDVKVLEKERDNGLSREEQKELDKLKNKKEK